MELFKLMRPFRQKHGISLSELGDAIGVSQQYISEIELSENVPTVQTQALIYKAFETVIAARQNEAKAMAEDYARCKDHLLKPAAHESEEIL